MDCKSLAAMMVWRRRNNTGGSQTRPYSLVGQHTRSELPHWVDKCRCGAVAIAVLIGVFD